MQQNEIKAGRKIELVTLPTSPITMGQLYPENYAYGSTWQHYLANTLQAVIYGIVIKKHRGAIHFSLFSSKHKNRKVHSFSVHCSMHNDHRDYCQLSPVYVFLGELPFSSLFSSSHCSTVSLLTEYNLALHGHCHYLDDLAGFHRGL